MTDDDRPDDSTVDVVTAGRFELDLSEPPSRSDVGISDGASGMTVQADEATSGPIDVRVVLPDQVTLDVTPRRVVVRARGRDGSTPSSGPPDYADLMFSFDAVADAEALLRDLAGQLGQRRAGLTDTYIAEVVDRMNTGTRSPSPRIATIPIGYLSFDVVPRVGTGPAGGADVHLTFTWPTAAAASPSP